MWEPIILSFSSTVITWGLLSMSCILEQYYLRRIVDLPFKRLMVLWGFAASLLLLNWLHCMPSFCKYLVLFLLYKLAISSKLFDGGSNYYIIGYCPITFIHYVMKVCGINKLIILTDCLIINIFLLKEFHLSWVFHLYFPWLISYDMVFALHFFSLLQSY